MRARLRKLKYSVLAFAVLFLVMAIISESGAAPLKLGTGFYNIIVGLEWETLSAGLFGLAGVLFVVEQTHDHFQLTNRRISDEKAIPIEEALFEVTRLKETATQIRLAMKMKRDTSGASSQMRQRTRHLKNRLDSYGAAQFNYDTYTAINFLAAIWPDNPDADNSDERLDENLLYVEQATQVAISRLEKQLNELRAEPL